MLLALHFGHCPTRQTARHKVLRATGGAKPRYTCSQSSCEGVGAGVGVGAKVH